MNGVRCDDQEDRIAQGGVEGGTSGGLQYPADVLYEIELLVRGARPEVLPVGGTIGLCRRSNSMRRRFEIARSYLFNLGPFAAIASACPT